MIGPQIMFYLDPTTGSLAFQAAIGGIVAGLAVVRIYWRRIKAVLGLSPREKKTDPPGSS